MKQMALDEKKRIEFLLSCGWRIPKIAEELGRHPSSIRNELLKHRLDSDKRRGYSNRLCANFEECTRKIFNGFGEHNCPSPSPHASLRTIGSLRGHVV